ncbi:MAG TPA: GNAT family N-acetyltransferase [Chitinophagaceae bacterium]|nr:GNAT family N-acetyltransferase [Chitinophagaceae bacterium]
MHLQQGYTVTTDITQMDVELIHLYLSASSYWAQGIPLSTVQKSMQHSLCFAIVYETSTVAFARIVSDYATFAYLCDVFVLPAHRGKGLSKYLMQSIHEHTALQGLRRWTLFTKDAHGLYQQFGWEVMTPEGAQRCMNIVHTNIYLQ